MKTTRSSMERTADMQTRNDLSQMLGIINLHRQCVSKAADDESLRKIESDKGHELMPVGMAQIPDVLFSYNTNKQTFRIKKGYD